MGQIGTAVDAEIAGHTRATRMGGRRAIGKGGRPPARCQQARRGAGGRSIDRAPQRSPLIIHQRHIVPEGAVLSRSRARAATSRCDKSHGDRPETAEFRQFSGRGRNPSRRAQLAGLLAQDRASQGANFSRKATPAPDQHGFGMISAPYFISGDGRSVRHGAGYYLTEGIIGNPSPICSRCSRPGTRWEQPNPLKNI